MISNSNCKWNWKTNAENGGGGYISLAGNNRKKRCNKSRRRVLFFSEAVTLAHVARPMVLAQYLADEDYDVHFASDFRYKSLFSDFRKPWHFIYSISSEAFINGIAKGKVVYDTALLAQYVEEDLDTIRKIKPDLIVGDFRFSLSISARVAGVPYMAITNAYWSPYARPKYQVPELPITKVMSIPMANAVFKVARPMAYAAQTKKINKVRKLFGLPSIGSDLRRAYTDADHVLYADLPGVIPIKRLPGHHHYIGPIDWSPCTELPEWWTELPKGIPIVYVNLGSSGDPSLLPMLMDALSSLPVSSIIATSGKVKIQKTYDNIWVTDFLPGEQAAQRSDLVICNGGSPSTFQALAAGVPVIGIASNLDQYLNMSYLEQSGAGKLLRAGRVTPPQVCRAVENSLGSKAVASAVDNIMRQLNLLVPEEQFCQIAAGYFRRHGGEVN